MHTHTCTNLVRYFKKSVSNSVNPERCRNVRHITWAGRVAGIWLPAGEASSLPQLIPQEPHAESVYGDWREKGGVGRTDIAYYVFPFAAGEGLSCVRLGCWRFSVVRGDRERRASHLQLLPVVSKPLLTTSVAGTTKSKASPPHRDTRQCLISACEFSPWEGCNEASG